MKATLLVYFMEGEPCITWIKDGVLADQVVDFIQGGEVLYLERYDYTLGECDIQFDDDLFIELLAGDGDV